MTEPDAAPELHDLRGLRRRVVRALDGKAVTEGSIMLERQRRLRQRAEQAEQAHHVDEAAVRALTEDVAAFERDAASLPPERVRASRSGGGGGGVGGGRPAWLVNATTVARKEVVLVLQGAQGLVLFGLFLLTFGIGLEAVLGGGVPGAQPSVENAWRYAHSLDFLSVPLAGLLLGYHLLNEERQMGTIHFLASKPVTRVGIAIGKWLGMAFALGVLVLASSLIVGGVALAVSGALGDAGVVLGFVAATYLLALAFASVAFVASALLDRGAMALGAGVGAYVALGIAWQNAFYLRQFESAGALPGPGRILLYLASPFTAWFNWTTELLGPRSDVSGLPLGDAWHEELVRAVERGSLDALPFYATPTFYVLVLAAWCLGGLAVAAWVFRTRDAA